VTPPCFVPTALRATHLRRGTRGVVAAIDAPAETAERLASLGLAPGAALRVIRCGSPMTLAVGEARFAIGATWAEALLVVPS
jgi:Fe2+ transport system protein FeoA